MKFHPFPWECGMLFKNQTAGIIISMPHLRILILLWMTLPQLDGVIKLEMTKVSQVLSLSKEVWDTLGEPSGKYDYMVKYSAPPSSQIAMENIVPTGWDEHYDDNFAFEEAREIPNNEGCFLSAYTPHQDAQVSIQNIIPTAWDGLIEHLAQPTEISQPGLSYPAEYITYPEGTLAHFPTNEINAVEDEKDNYNSWILPAHNSGLNNWKAEDVISFDQE